MASFDLAIPVVMQEEGGLSANPADSGGLTKFGISHATFPGVDITSLTLDQAKQLIKQTYWRFDPLVDQTLATKLLDMAVNLGLPEAITLLQRSLVFLGTHLGVDGIFGPETISTCNGSSPQKLLAELRTMQQAFYVQLVAAKPQDYPFLTGWLRRANVI